MAEREKPPFRALLVPMLAVISLLQADTRQGGNEFEIEPGLAQCQCKLRAGERDTRLLRVIANDAVPMNH
jgi:hypothetical protein